MSDNTIKIRATLDSSEFDKQIKDLQNKFKALSTPQNQQSKSLVSAAFGEYSPQNQQQMQNMFRSINQQMIEDLKNIKAKKDLLKEILDTEGKLTREQKTRAEAVEKEIRALKDKVTNLKQAKADISGQGAAADTKTPDEAPKTESMLKKMITPALLASVATTAFKVFKDTYQYNTYRDAGMTKEAAGALSSANREASLAYGGRGYELEYYKKERLSALNKASDIFQRTPTGDLLNALGSVGGMAAGGAAMGAVGGSVVPVLGTAAGAITGAAGGAMMGAAGVLGNDRLRARLLDPERYEIMKVQDFASNYDQMLTAEKAQNYEKVQAMDFFQSNVGKLGGMQRSLGLNDYEFYGASTQNSLYNAQRKEQLGKDADALMAPAFAAQGGKAKRDTPSLTEMYFGANGRRPGDQNFLKDPLVNSPLASNAASNSLPSALSPEEFNPTMPQRDDYVRSPVNWLANNRGYGSIGPNDDLTIGAVQAQAQAMQQQGALTTDISGTANAGMAARMAQAGIGSAGAMMGRISNAGVSDSAEVLKKIMTAAVAQGINISELPKEMERFTDIATSFATSGGGFSQSAATDLATLMGDNKTAMGMSSAADVYQTLQNNAKSTEGLRGQIGMGAAAAAGAKGYETKMTVSSMSAADLEKDPEMLQAMARKLGKSEEQTIAFAKDRELKQTILNTKDRQRFEKLQKTYHDPNATEQERQDAKFEAKGVVSKYDPNLAKDKASLEATLNIGMASTEKPSTTTIDKQVSKARQGNILTQAEGQQGAGESLQMGNFNQYYGEIKTSMTNFKAAADSAAEAFHKFLKEAQQLPEAARSINELSKAFGDMLENLQTKTLAP